MKDGEYQNRTYRQIVTKLGEMAALAGHLYFNRLYSEDVKTVTDPFAEELLRDTTQLERKLREMLRTQSSTAQSSGDGGA